MVELPKDIYDNHNIRKYTKLDTAEHQGLVLGMWERETDERDHIENDEHFYYGEWVAVPEAEIELINKEMSKIKKKMQAPIDSSLTAREAEIAEAKRLLASLLGAEDEENEDYSLEPDDYEVELDDEPDDYTGYHIE